MMEYLVEIKNLSFTYPDGTNVLRNISQSIKAGECIAIVGPNGCGKTTLLYHLNGIIPNLIGGKITGSVKIDKKLVSQYPIYQNAKEVGIVFQDPEFQIINPDITLECAFAPSNIGLPRAEILKRVKWALNTVGLEGIKNKSTHELSDGQKQRLSIASTLTLLPKVLLLDEPTSQLDPKAVSEFLAVLKKLKNENKLSLVIITHNLEEILCLVDRIIVLSKKGKIAFEGTLSEIAKDHDTLNSLPIKLPPVTELSLRLKLNNKIKLLPFSVEEAYNTYSDLISKNELKINSNYNQDCKEKEEIDRSNIIIETDNLSYTYPNGSVGIDNINIKIAKGESVAIIGENGSGKSTLIKSIAGLLKPTKGKILLKNKDLNSYSRKNLLGKIGVVLQNPEYQLFADSIEEEVAFSLNEMGLSQDEIKRRVEQSLKITNLEDKKDIFPAKLGFGEKKKVVIATLIALSPEIIILDEPSTGLDNIVRTEIGQFIERLTKNGHTVIIVTHDMEYAARYAERTIVLSQGKVLFDDLTFKVFEKSDILEKSFFKLPQITELSRKLSKFGVPNNILTVEEMYNLFQ